MVGGRNQRQEYEQRERVRTPQRCGGFAQPERREIGDQQGENEQRDEAGFVRDRAEPLGAKHEAPESETRDGNRDRDGERGGEIEVESSENSVAREEMQADALREVVDGDEREGAESPEDEGVRESGQRALADHCALQQHFPDEVANAPSGRLQSKFRILLGAQDGSPDFAESQPEAESRTGGQDEKHPMLHKLRV